MDVGAFTGSLGFMYLSSWVTALCVWLVSVIVHERAHYVYARKLGLRPVFYFDGSNPTVMAEGFETDEDLIGFYLSGVLWGLVPIILVGLLPVDWSLLPLGFGTILVMYGVGCWSDLFKVYKVVMK